MTAYTYNYLQRLSTVAQPGGGSLNYSYDAAGNLVSLIDPVGNETTYAYVGHRVTASSDPSGLADDLGVWIDRL